MPRDLLSTCILVWRGTVCGIATERTYEGSYTSLSAAFSGGGQAVADARAPRGRTDHSSLSMILRRGFSSAIRFLEQHAVKPGEEFNLLCLAGSFGGRFYLKDDTAWQQLYQLQAEDADQSLPQFLVPQRPKNSMFPLTLDLDFVHQTHKLGYLEETLLPAICQGAAKAMCNHPQQFRFILAVAAEKQTQFTTREQPDQKITGFKTGGHMHFQSMTAQGKGIFVSVDKETALRLRTAILVHLYSELGPNHGGNEMEDVVDEAVLGGANG